MTLPIEVALENLNPEKTKEMEKFGPNSRSTRIDSVELSEPYLFHQCKCQLNFNILLLFDTTTMLTKTLNIGTDSAYKDFT